MALAVRITLLLLGLVVAGVFAASVWLLTLDLEPYEQAIERATSKALDRDFEIEGDLGLVLALFPTISADGIRLGNASWGTTGDLLQIERAEGVIRPLPLLRGRLEFSRLVFFQPVVRLETDAQGRGNWMFDDGEPASEEAERAISLPAALEDLEALQIERGALDLRHASGRLERSWLEKASIERRREAEPGFLLDLEGSYQEVPFSLEGTTGELDAYLQAQVSQLPVDLVLELADARATLAGALLGGFDLPDFDLSLEADVPRLGPLAELLLLPDPGVERASVNAMLSARDGIIRIDELLGNHERGQIQGQVEIDASGEKPKIRGRLSTSLLELSTGEGRKPRARVFSTEPLPLELLHGFDAQLDLHADLVRIDSVELRQVELLLVRRAGRLRAGSLSFGIADGVVEGQIAIDGSGSSNRIEVQLDAKQVELARLLDQLMGTTAFEGGRTDASLRARGSGDSVAAIMGSLDGRFTADIGRAQTRSNAFELVDVDLLSMLASVDPSYERKESITLECVTFLIDAQRGVAKSEEGIAWETPKIAVLASGQLNLATERIDLMLRPQPKKPLGLGFAQLANLVHIGGTLSEPKQDINPASVLGGTAKIGKSIGRSLVGTAVSTSRALLDLRALTPERVDKTPCRTIRRRLAPGE